MVNNADSYINHIIIFGDDLSVMLSVLEGKLFHSIVPFNQHCLKALPNFPSTEWCNNHYNNY